jgi:hypothetical protein
MNSVNTFDTHTGCLNLNKPPNLRHIFHMLTAWSCIRFNAVTPGLLD